MDLVPGLVSQFWFTPTKTGRFEIMCAEYCGTAHFNMRGHVVVEEPERF
jgi:cytochrome c oxidase subunit 2